MNLKPRFAKSIQCLPRKVDRLEVNIMQIRYFVKG